LLLVDTPGFSAPDMQAASDLADALSNCPNTEAVLVVEGYMKARDLRRCIQKYELFRFTKVLITKMDETEAFGSVLSEVIRAGKLISFLANGPRIPDDIQTATPEGIAGLVLRRELMEAQSAA